MHIPASLLEALRVGTPLAYELPPSNPERLAGIIILPKEGIEDKKAKKGRWKARIPDRSFFVAWREYSRKHIEKDWDIVEGDGMWEIRSAEVVGENALEQLLQQWNIPLDALTYLWKTDIPE